MDNKRLRRSVVSMSCIGIVAVGIVVGGAYALVGIGNHYAIGKSGSSVQSDEAAVATTGTVVARVKNTAALDPESMIITVPLGEKFQKPGRLYGTNAKQPIQLGPPGVKGMTQDGFGSQSGILLPDGRYLLYPYWEQLMDFPDESPGGVPVPDGTHIATPSIRILDLASGEDREVVSGARSMAYRADGVFAYAEGVDADYRYNIPYLQRVVVRNTVDGESSVWTKDADRYTVLCWVKNTLFVKREFIGEGYEVLALSGPGQMRQVVSEKEQLVAVSPDGNRILIASGETDPSQATLLRVVEWETGIETCRLSLNGVRESVSSEQIRAFAGGSWEGDTIVVPLSPADIAVLSISECDLALRDVITLKYPKLRAGSIGSPMLNSTATKIFMVAAEGTDKVELERTAIVSYDLVSGECTRWIAPGAPALTGLVANSSRPR